VNNQFTGR